MPIVVLYFAALKELVGTGEEQLSLPEGCRTVSAALEHLEGLHPELRAHRSSVRLALNESFVSGDPTLSAGDTLALIPPVSGG